MDKPKPRNAEAVSTSATALLFVFVLMAASDSPSLGAPIVGICDMVLILVAISEWNKYYQRLIDYKIGQASHSRPDV